MSMTNMEALTRIDRDFDEDLPDLDNLPQTRDPGRDNFIDEKTADALEESAKQAAEERGEFDVASIWNELSEEQRIALMASGEMGRAEVIHPKSPRFIDEKKVPARLHCRWISMVAGLGYRGYVPVLRTPETCEWVPNAPRYGKSKVFVVGTSVLCAIPKKDWLARVYAEHMQANTTNFQAYNEGFDAALKVLSKKFGITEAQAKKLDRAGVSGFTMTKGPDPHGKRDMVDADEVAKAKAAPPQRATRKRG